LQELLEESGREQEFRAKVSEWPTLAEVDALRQIGWFDNGFLFLSKIGAAQRGRLFELTIK
jgi:hypothetical protein